MQTSAAERKRFFRKQAYYEEGEQTGRLLAISALCTADRVLTNSLEVFMEELVRSYEELYLPKTKASPLALAHYPEHIALLQLYEPHRQALDSPIREEKIVTAIASFPNYKAPGEDGLPKLYSELLSPQLLQVYRVALERGYLADSMSKVHIVLLLKQGKQPTDPSSYRSISLLPVDVKILAKILAMWLSKCITTIIHLDQSGFMALKSTVIDIRQVYLNMQTQVDNVGHRALLSLDANKAFDGLELPYLWQTLRHFWLWRYFYLLCPFGLPLGRMVEFQGPLV